MALANMPPLSLTADSKDKPAVISDQMLDEISTFLRNLSQCVTYLLDIIINSINTSVVHLLGLIGYALVNTSY